jgi:hypothetical protein
MFIYNINKQNSSSYPSSPPKQREQVDVKGEEEFLFLFLFLLMIEFMHHSHSINFYLTRRSLKIKVLIYY